MARARCHAFFASAIGECAIAWNDVGLTAIWLPEATREALQRRVRRHAAGTCETPPSGAIAEVVDGIGRLLRGEHVGFDGVALDLEHTDPFDRRVYALTRAIPAGRVLTYGDIAGQLGMPDSARAVGQSLGRNPWPIVVPCHRVVAAGNALGGFSAPGGAVTKRRLLAIERARRPGVPDLFDDATGEPALADLGSSGSEPRAGH